MPLDSINNIFQNVALTDRHKSAESFTVPADSHDAAFQFGELSVEVVLSYLSSLDVSKATGPDGLSARFLKEISSEIAEPLTTLYNESLRTGIIPLEWKRSHITPVHKGAHVMIHQTFVLLLLSL